MDLTQINPHHTLDTDSQTPPPIQPTNTSKSVNFTNGSLLKRLHRPTPASTVVSYKECLKNHAATLGGHALDGCGEFMPSPASNPSDPRSLKCAACGCHRNFHRRDFQELSNPNILSYFSPPPAEAPLLPRRGLSPSTSPSSSLSRSPTPSPTSSPSPSPVSHFPPSFPLPAPHMLLALGSAYSVLPEEKQRNLSSTIMKMENPVGKKRYRTKFSQEQKEKMCLFSQKVGWKMQKGDERLVQEFCNEVGVSRGVFKVWMHNNKNTFRKRSEVGNNTENKKINGFDSDSNNPHNNTNSGRSEIHTNEGSSVNLHVSVN